MNLNFKRHKAKTTLPYFDCHPRRLLIWEPRVGYYSFSKGIKYSTVGTEYVYLESGGAVSSYDEFWYAILDDLTEPILAPKKEK